MMDNNSNSMYDTFSTDYDRFVNWPGRLALEMPFIEAQLTRLETTGPLRLLDAACGTGQHAIALAQRGYAVCGADLSAGMIERARLNAAQADVKINFRQAGFGNLAPVFEADLNAGGFDALLCLGNSLPHLTDGPALAGALADFAKILRPGGLFILQNRNFDAVVAGLKRWMEPQSQHEAGVDRVFLRFYDFLSDGLIQFNLITLQRSVPSENWTQTISASLLYPQRRSELEAALLQAGFKEIKVYGALNDSPFDAVTSGNLVITARRS